MIYIFQGYCKNLYLGYKKWCWKCCGDEIFTKKQNMTLVLKVHEMVKCVLKVFWGWYFYHFKVKCGSWKDQRQDVWSKNCIVFNFGDIRNHTLLFLLLFRHANLILNLFSLMVDAEIPDIALEPDKTVKKVIWSDHL